MQCDSYGESRFHVDDYRIDCTSTEYHITMLCTCFMILLVPFGVPGIFAYKMWEAKQSLGGAVNETVMGGAKLSPSTVDEESDDYGFLTSELQWSLNLHLANIVLMCQLTMVLLYVPFVNTRR